MKNAFVVTISLGYMFSLNATINAMRYFGTDADFYILYEWQTPKELIEAYKKAFPNTFWIPLDQWGSGKRYNDNYHKFFADKYDYALKIKDEYDAVCIIDGDLFICCNVNEYFKMAAEGKFITAEYLYCGMPIDSFYSQSLDQIIDRCYCAFADLSVFINAKMHSKFLSDWLEQTFIPILGTECNHPLIAMNRSIKKNIPKESFVVLDGNRWACDKNYWSVEYIRKGDKLFNNLGEVYAIHNRWWQPGRASGEWLANTNITSDNKGQISGVDRAQNNMNVIVNYMEWFNDMTPETRIPYYRPEPHNWRTYLGKEPNFGK